VRAEVVLTVMGGEWSRRPSWSPRRRRRTGRLYYFAIKTRDEARNVSDMSNVASAVATY